MSSRNLVPGLARDCRGDFPSCTAHDCALCSGPGWSEDPAGIEHEGAPMSPPFTILGIDHVVLRAADPAVLERFYLDVLGCSFEKRQGKLAQLRAGTALIDIVPADGPGPAQGTSANGGANLDH